MTRTITNPASGSALISATIRTELQTLENEIAQGTNPGHLHTVAGISATGTPSASTYLRGDGSWASIAGSGTVTSVSVATANGFAGTVATATTTPAITITTSLTQNSIPFVGASANFTEDTTNFVWDATNHNLRVGPTSGAITSENRLSVIGNANDYHGIFTQNLSAGLLASTDIVAANNVGGANDYFDFGVNSSANTNASFTLFGVSDAYIFTGPGGALNNINIATGTAAKVIKFGVGGLLVANEVGRFTATGLTIGLAGTTKGILTLSGNTSGTTLLQPAAAASGTLTLPAATDTVAVLAAAQAFTNKTYNGNTLTAGTFTLTGGASKTLTFNNTLTLSGTDSTTMTFPSTTATIARTDAAQTFTGTQTFSQVNKTANAIAASSNAATVPITSGHNIVTNSSAATLTITMTTTSAVNMQTCIVQILDFSAVAQTITWVNTENSTVSAPTTSNGSTTLPLSVGFIYNSATSKWRCTASA